MNGTPLSLTQPSPGALLVLLMAPIMLPIIMACCMPGYTGATALAIAVGQSQVCEGLPLCDMVDGERGVYIAILTLEAANQYDRRLPRLYFCEDNEGGTE